MFRQGDVLLLPVVGLPAGAARQLRTGDIILAEGEVTGHAHRIKELQAEVYSGTAGARFLHVKETVNLIHEEHGEIAVPPGAYRAVQQREWDGVDAGPAFD